MSTYVITCAVIAVFYLSRMSNANKIDEEFGEGYYDTMWAIDSPKPIPITDKDSHFSTIFAFSGVLMAIFVPLNFAYIIGNYFFRVRLFLTCIGCCASCTYLVNLILVLVWRFNSVGKLAAESLTPTEFDDSVPLLKINPAGRTYADDASLILTITIVQIVWCCVGNCGGIAIGAIWGSNQ